jgi:regulator of RNase E activity RraA
VSTEIDDEADNDSVQQIGASLLRLGSATLGESGALTAHPRLRPAWVGATLAGPAYPVACTPGDNLAVHVGVREAPAVC